MATRSNIAIQNEDGTYTRIYCHWDGYPEYMLPMLNKNYNSVELAEKLISGGNIRHLDASCDCPEGHTSAKPVDGYTVYYGRDNNTPESEPKIFSVRKEIELLEEEYLYIFCRSTQQWLCMSINYVTIEDLEIKQKNN